MAAKSFLRLVAGKWQQIRGVVISAGASNAGDIVALDDSGRLDSSVMPVGIGANTQSIPASEALSAGNFVNFYSNAGVLNVRKADNSNGRRADGFVLAAVASGATATVYPMDSVNSALSGLTPATEYFLGTAGGVVATPLDETLTANQGVGKISQLLGTSKSATELVTNDCDPVIL